ncbi:MAG: quinone oxidoreductase family protein [Caulobacteraceae bacterium]
MLAIQIERTGGPEVLEPRTLPDPEPGPGQIRIRHGAIGLNFVETYHRSGLYPMTLPKVLGQEGAGTVDAVGEGVTRFHVGDRAAYVSGSSGSYAELAVIDEGKAVNLPRFVSDEEAAAIMLKGLTVEMLVQRVFPLKAGQWALVHAAAGGVGQLLTQWAKAIGATVVATAGSAEKLRIAQENGADHLISYADAGWADEVRTLTDGRGVEVVYDGVGKDTFDGSLGSLAKRGHMVLYGGASGPVPPVDPLALMRGGSLYLTRPTLFDYAATTEELDAAAKAMFAQMRDGKLKVSIGQRFALKDAADAHRALEARQTTGSTLLIP